MILINDYDRFSNIMAVPLDFVWIWMEIEGLPAILTTAPTAKLIGETVGELLHVDYPSINKGVARVRLTLPLNNLVRLERCIRVSLEDVLLVNLSLRGYWVDAELVR
ncbi:hypothetical protein ACLB2K_010906 [Fragaria x ananassa]